MSFTPAQMLGCEYCGTVSAAPNAEDDHTLRLRCPHCGNRLHARKPRSLQRTWALLAASVLLYVPANLLPIMTTTNVFRSNTYTIAGGIGELWTDKAYGLAAIVFVASIIVPLLKIVALALLAWTARRRSGWRRLERAKLYRVVETVGHWSMLDVYVVVLLVGMVRFGKLASVQPEPGLIAFAAVVILTMFAARSFDPRLIWQEHAPRG
ncbi:paraquat-inducible protein A [Piscinibacter terrae]|uniref:Paraquat-inducible membrane protein A n=1 Tax=Piscinibacter terrae TaxID=2496871 RepID=A0A3N7HRW5_9BURK|nr:paraquat-inducible protein A [Albitalea terrae]RQP24997.1 paraquat-inducible membrane protein A [Albitalea terrae]